MFMSCAQCYVTAYLFSKHRRVRDFLHHKVGKVDFLEGRRYQTAVLCRASDSWTLGES